MHYFRNLGVAVFLSGATASMAYAQVSVPTAPTNVPGIKVVAPPPAGFDPVSASSTARMQFAIPPAPDATVAPGAYNEWKKAVSGIRNRIAAPVLRQTNIANGPIKNKKLGGPLPPDYAASSNSNNILNGAAVVTSNNWSGPSFVNNSNPFALEAIVGEFVVPTAHVAFGSCTAAVYSSQWPGIDGNGSPDVLQAGVEADAFCSGGTTTTFYSAWIEWFPFSETQVSSPVIHPGDLVYVQVWNGSSTVGYAYFFNFSTQISAQYQLTAPSGTNLVGNSIEWIVERPGVGGGLATLTNYIDVSWPYNVAWNYASPKPTFYYPYVVPATGTLEFIQMLDNNGNGISYGAPQNTVFYYFHDYGSANGGSVAPYL
jgi:hypothetical protein